MPRATILALILAGGEGNRMSVLTEARAKPALPFAGVYRLIDIPLSNCVHSALADVWVIEQFEPHSLNDHLVNGRPWDLDRTYGGLRLLPPHTGSGAGGWHRGNADAIYRNARLIREFDPDLLLVLSADHLYKLDFRTVVDAHREREAAVTMVTTEVPRAEAGRFGNVEVGGDGKVTRFAYKPDEPLGRTVTTEIFLYTTRTLLQTLDELAAESGDDQDDEESGLKDFGHQLLPRLVDAGQAFALPLDGYWRDVGTIESYYAAHIDLLQPAPPLDLDSPDWPIRTLSTPRCPAYIERSARIDNSLIAPGCRIGGEVVNSVLGPGVVVAPGASVRDAIIFDDAVIEPDATVVRAIIDQAVQIGRAARIGAPGDADEDSIALVGARARIAPDAQIKPGARIKPAPLND